MNDLLLKQLPEDISQLLGSGEELHEYLHEHAETVDSSFTDLYKDDPDYPDGAPNAGITSCAAEYVYSYAGFTFRVNTWPDWDNYGSDGCVEVEHPQNPGEFIAIERWIN